MSFSVGGPHQTDNLPGYPARDYMAPGGTPLYAWENLRVVRISGSSGGRSAGFGGFNLYLSDRTGRNFFVTHVENVGVKVGDVLHPGQRIATVGNYTAENGMATHTHIGWQGGDPLTVLGLKPDYLFTPGGAVAGAKVIDENTTKSRTSTGGTWHGPLANVPVLGPAGRATTRGLDWVLHPVDQAIGVVKAPFNALEWTTKNWDRVLEVVGGSLLVIVGLVLMGRSLGVTKTKVELVEKVGAYQGAREYAAAGSPPPAKRENLRRPVAVHEATDAGERRASRRSSGYDPGSAEIPY